MSAKRNGPPRPAPVAPALSPALEQPLESAGVVWPEVEAAPPRRRLSPELERAFDIAITVGGLIVATLLGIGLAIVEALYSPLRVHGVRVPVSLLMAVVTNPLLGWFAFTTTRSRLAALLPAAGWCVVWILAAGRTSEGDLIITEDNWVGLMTLFAGPLAFAIGIYISSMRPRPVPPRAPDAAPPAPAAP
ncbi:hypothetical protein ACQP00_04785 [Dactylosporangium sp. CS-047395]|uniref:hypothetical protein n=1 Tax=Dactylosporangium sp. CS-047395 TaxID=3239936 RepID=UPI003D8DFCD9